MAEGEVVTKLRLDGSDQVKTGLAQVNAGVQEYLNVVTKAKQATFDWTKANLALRAEQNQLRTILAAETKAIADRNAGIKNSSTVIGNLIGSLQGSKAGFTGAAASAQGFGSALGIIGAAAKAATSPLGILVVTIGAAVGVMTHMANETVGLFKEMRDLSAVTGGTASEAEDLKDTFALAGLGTEQLSFAMFRLGTSMETGGKELEHLGVSLRGAGGELKQTGVVFDEIRAKIAALSSSTERAAAAAEIFGALQARRLMPILSMSAERYSDLRKRAEENTSVTEGLMDATSKYIEVQAELNDKLEMGRARFAELIALPVMTKFTEWGIAVLDTVKALDKFGLTMERVARFAIATIPGFNALFAAWDLYNAATAKQDEKVEQQQTKAVTPNVRLIESEIKALQERARIQDEMTTLRLKGEQAAFAEESKMRTGSDQAAVQSRMAMNEKLITLAEDRYTRERALAEERISKTTGGRLAPEEELKLERERDVAIQALRQDNAKALIEIEQARAAKSLEIAADEIKGIKAHNAEILGLVDSVAKRQIARLEMSTKSTQEITAQRYQIERQSTDDLKTLKLIELNEQQARLQALSDAHKGNYAVQRQVQEQIMALSQERVQVEQAADVQIIQQRQKMVADLQNLAREEAGIGDQLTNKAIENLRKRGKTRVSEADVMQESARIQRTGIETIGAFGGGARVSMDKLQEAMSMKSTFEGMAKGGFNIAGAVQQAVSQAFAAFTGQRQQFAPTGTDPALMQQLGMGGAAGTMGVQMEGMQARIATAGDKGIALLLERIPAIMEGWMVKVTDGLIRKLEFEAART